MSECVLTHSLSFSRSPFSPISLLSSPRFLSLSLLSMRYTSLLMTGWNSVGLFPHCHLCWTWMASEISRSWLIASALTESGRGFCRNSLIDVSFPALKNNGGCPFHGSWQYDDRRSAIFLPFFSAGALINYPFSPYKLSGPIQNKHTPLRHYLVFQTN